MAPPPRVSVPAALEPMTQVRHLVVGSLVLFSFLTIVDRVAISATKPYMAAELGINDVTFGFIFGVFALGYALFQVPSGWAADRYGPRALLTAIVIAWSLFTGITGLLSTVPLLITVRFLFGAAEAGIYPTATRALYNWVPSRDRGAAQGLLFIGSRLGAAFGLSLVSIAITKVGWRGTFGVLAIVGIVLAVIWAAWFRDTPAEMRRVSSAELAYIRGTEVTAGVTAHATRIWNVDALLLAVQYFASNFTFFIAFSWLLPYLHSRYSLTAAEAGLYASFPLYFGAAGNWISGLLVDAIYRSGYWRQSRVFPAAIGFGLAIAGLVAAPSSSTVTGAVICFSLATLGVDMTLSPSWTACQDLAGPRTGVLSGAMNMVGNLGSFVSSIAFPTLLQATGNVGVYFYLAAALNLVAILCWLRVRPDRGVTDAWRLQRGGSHVEATRHGRVLRCAADDHS
jgi:ACS family glucarate transporter-like MFS transporter